MRQAGGSERFKSDIPLLFRQSIDEVIDTPRSGRFTLGELEKTEKTYIGTKVEILLRNHLKLPKGSKLDLLIDGVEVDVKNTVMSNWTIPSEAMGHPCLLLKEDEDRAVCSFGIIVIRDYVLNAGENRDKKRSISKKGLEGVLWLLRNHPYPENFWQSLAADIRRQITSPAGGTERVANLFRLIQNRPVSRSIVQGLTQQKDYMKRIRRNGGARDQLARESIAILWGQKDGELIRKMGLPKCGASEFISYQPKNSDEEQLLRIAGHID